MNKLVLRFVEVIKDKYSIMETAHACERESKKVCIEFAIWYSKESLKSNSLLFTKTTDECFDIFIEQKKF